MSAAMELAGQGHNIVLVEKSERTGGSPRLYNCKAIDVCQKCGACLAAELAYKVENEPLIEVLLDSNLLEIESLGNGFSARIDNAGTVKTVKIKGVIIAIGAAVINPAIRPEFGYGRYHNVLTIRDLEHMLSDASDWESVLGKLPQLAFIQCFGSRDPACGVPYCSRVCCMYAPQMAHKLMDKVPGATVDIYYMDRQQYQDIYNAQPTNGIDYIRAIPARAANTPNGQVELVYEDADSQGGVTASYDWVALCPAIVPSEDIKEIAAKIGVNIDQYGFLEMKAVDKKSGVFAAGVCAGPLSIIESIASGRLAAEQLMLELGV